MAKKFSNWLFNEANKMDGLKRKYEQKAGETENEEDKNRFLDDAKFRDGMSIGLFKAYSKYVSVFVEKEEENE